MRLHPLRPMLLCLALLAASGHDGQRIAAAPTNDACPDTTAASTAERTDDSAVDETVAPARL